MLLMDIHKVYAVFQRHFRRKRMAQFISLFGVIEATRILDVGGTAFNWKLFAVRPQVTLLNINGLQAGYDNFVFIEGDGRHLEFTDGAFDIVYSNSVIEHVGGWEDQVSFAREAIRVGKSYYVQTPNRWFFVEPHLLTPFVHYLPHLWVKALARNFTVWGWLTRPSRKEAEDFVDNIRLLGEREMRQLFPDARILKERFFGFTKSLIAVRIDAHAAISLTCTGE